MSETEKRPPTERQLGVKEPERLEKGSYEHTTPRENTNETKDRPGKR